MRKSLTYRKKIIKTRRQQHCSKIYYLILSFGPKKSLLKMSLFFFVGGMPNKESFLFQLLMKEFEFQKILRCEKLVSVQLTKICTKKITKNIKPLKFCRLCFKHKISKILKRRNKVRAITIAVSMGPCEWSPVPGIPLSVLFLINIRSLKCNYITMDYRIYGSRYL